MRWRIGTLYGLTQTGTDETHKPVCELTEIGTAHFRTLPFKAVEQPVVGNGFDLITRTWFTAKTPNTFENVSEIALGGYRWTVAHYAAFRDGAAVTVYRTKKPVGATGATGITGATGNTGVTSGG